MEKEERSLRPRKRVDYTKTHIDRTPAWLGVGEHDVDNKRVGRKPPVKNAAAGAADVGAKPKRIAHHKKKTEKSRKAHRELADGELPTENDKREKRKVKFEENPLEIPRAEEQRTLDIASEGDPIPGHPQKDDKCKKDRREVSPVRLRKSDPQPKGNKARFGCKEALSLPGETARKSPQRNEREKSLAKNGPTAILKKRRQERGPSELEADFGKKKSKREKRPDEKETFFPQKKDEKKSKGGAGETAMEEVEEIDCVRRNEGGPSNFAGALVSGSEPMEECLSQGGDAQELAGANKERSIILSPKRGTEIGRSSFAHLKREYWHWVENEHAGKKNWVAENARKIVEQIDVAEKAIRGTQDTSMFWKEEAEKQALFAVGGKETATRLKQARAEMAEKDAAIVQKDAAIAQKDSQLKELMQKLKELEKAQETPVQPNEEAPLQTNALDTDDGQGGERRDEQQPTEGPSEVQNCSIAIQVDPQSPSLVAEPKRMPSFAALSRRVSEGLGEQQPQSQTGNGEFSFCTSPGGGTSKKQALLGNPMDEHTIEMPSSGRNLGRRQSVIDLLSNDGTPVRHRNTDTGNNTQPISTASEKFRTPTSVRRRPSMIGSGAGKRLSMTANTAQLSTIPESREPFSTESVPRHSKLSFGDRTTSPQQKRMSNCRLSYGPLENLEHLGFKVESRSDGLIHTHSATGFSFWIGESDIDPRIWLEHQNENFDQTQDDLNFQQICYKPCEFGTLENDLPEIMKEELTFLRSTAAGFVENVGEALEEIFRLQASKD